MDYTHLLETLTRRTRETPLRKNVVLALIDIESEPGEDEFPALKRVIEKNAGHHAGTFDLIPVGGHRYGLIVCGEPHERNQVLSGVQTYISDRYRPGSYPATYSVASAIEAWSELRKFLRRFKADDFDPTFLTLKHFKPRDEDLALLTLKIAEASLECSKAEETFSDIALLAKGHPKIKFLEWDQLRDFPKVNARVTDRMREMLPLEQITHLRKVGREKWAARIDAFNERMIATELSEFVHTVRSKNTSMDRLFTLIALIYIATEDEDDDDTIS